MMSEAELHQLKIRLHAGAQQKAERGELHQPLPVGLQRQRDGHVIFTPDEEVQARLRLVFAQFDVLASAGAVMRYLQDHDLPVPTRPLRGPGPHEIIWQPATRERVLAILHNPAYAGAYVHGRTLSDVRGVTQRPLEQWPICLQDIYPAYISWEKYLYNRQRLQSNQSRYQAERHGVARQGQALLQGLVVCGRCGARMRLRYTGRHGQYPAYSCREARRQQDLPRCQEVRALALDAAVEQQLLAALEPDKLTLALAALEQLEQETAALQRQWQLRLERARYEAQRAQRQFQAVEPENRLVARTLEGLWEEKLQAVEALEHDYQHWSAQQVFTLADSDRQRILALGEDLPKLWQAATTTSAERKQIVRLVIQSVIVDAKRQQGQLWYQIHWQTGATQEYWLRRAVHGYREHPQQQALEQRVRELNRAGNIDATIATCLNAEGFRSARGQAFSSNVVWLLRQQWHIPAVKTNGKDGNPLRWEDGSYSVEGLAKAVGVTVATVYKWLYQGRVKGRQLGKAMPWKLSVTPTDMVALRAHVKQTQRINRSKMEAS